MPAPLRASDRVYDFCVNEAVTLWAAFMVTLQLPVPLQAPPQPLKVEEESGEAVSVTVCPALKAAEQVAPQEMLAGLDVMVPLPLPVFDVVSG